jgi:hypothetical protein
MGQEDFFMGKLAQLTKNNIIAAVVAVLVIAGGGIGLWVHDSSSSVTVVKNSSSQTVELSYKGQDGKNALALLKTHANVQTKSSSLGEYVTSINGNDGGGSKYWIFYVNGKEAQVGAGAYVTHNGDTIEWKLQ